MWHPQESFGKVLVTSSWVFGQNAQAFGHPRVAFSAKGCVFQGTITWLAPLAVWCLSHPRKWTDCGSDALDIDCSRHSSNLHGNWSICGAMCQSHYWLDFKQRGFTTNHHMQDTNGDSLLVVVGHPLTCGIQKNHLGKFGHIQLGFWSKYTSIWPSKGCIFSKSCVSRDNHMAGTIGCLVSFPSTKVD